MYKNGRATLPDFMQLSTEILKTIDTMDTQQPDFEPVGWGDQELKTTF